MLLKLIIFMIFIITLYSNEPISPIPIKVDCDMPKAMIGKELFFDTMLSSDNTISCFSCHNVYDGGADHRIVSLGVHNRKGNIQSPTVLNARYNFTEFWNGRAKDLYAQASGPLNNPAEHGMNPQKIEKAVNNSSHYKEMFKKVYGTSHITYKMVLESIVEFEKALITPNSRFDKYLRGEIKLTSSETQGYKLFKQYGCITCHNGVNIGGNSYQKMGIFIPIDEEKHYPDRMEVTKNILDKDVFKVPTLRNIDKTAPYFHDGSSKTLEDAIQSMSKHNLGMFISDEDTNYLMDFLKSLDGEEPKILEQP